MQIDPETGEIRKVFLRTANNYDMNKASDQSALYCPEPTKTQQHFKEETDINTIVRRFGLTGELPQNLQDRTPLEGDYTDAIDYRQALHLVKQADAAFLELPANIRARFANDPQNFLTFVQDEKNREEAKKLGFLRPEPQSPEPTLVRVVPEPEATPPAK